MRQPQRGDHLCLFYQRLVELWPLAAAFARGGLASGEQCLCVTEEYDPDTLLSALRDHGLPVPAPTQLLIRTADEIGLTANPFSVGQAVSAWQLLAESAIAAGHKGLRLVVDMSWILRNPSSLARLAEYEARAEQCFSAASITALCYYNQQRFPEEILLDALRTHPAAAVEGRIRENQFYIPPDIFLRQDRRAQFYWHLRQLDPSRRTTLDGAESAPPAKASPWEAATRRRPIPLVAADNHPPEDPANWRWQVYCLGKLRVQRHDGAFVNWNAAKGATKKIKTLFAYLLQRGKTGASAEQLADLLWPDEPDRHKTMGRLYHTIHALRLALEPGLTSGRDSRYLSIREGQCFLRLPDETWLDVEAFEQFCYRGERLLEAGDDDNALACYLAADKLYTGDLLADIPLIYAERTDDDWCWSRRYWMQEMYLKLLVGLAGIHRRRGATEEVLACARRALALDPCNEIGHREMMLSLHLAGRPDALERHYQICREALRRHEGRPPESETVRLYESLAQPGAHRAHPQTT